MKLRLAVVSLSVALGALLYVVPAAPRESMATERSVSLVSAVTTVTATMTDSKFVLSARVVPRGTVVFRLVNKGRMAHDFKIAGKKSRLIKPGGRGTLRVTFGKTGSFPYICTVPGHAKAGMKGVLRVVLPGATTRVSVSMTDFDFALTATTVPRGTIIFGLVNRGSVGHDFQIAGKKSAVLGAGETGTLTISILSAGNYPYLCTLPGHAESGMRGVLKVT